MEGYRAADLVVLALEIAGRISLLRNSYEALESITDYEDLFGYKLASALRTTTG